MNSNWKTRSALVALFFASGPAAILAVPIGSGAGLTSGGSKGLIENTENLIVGILKDGVSKRGVLGTLLNEGKEILQEVDTLVNGKEDSPVSAGSAPAAGSQATRSQTPAPTEAQPKPEESTPAQMAPKGKENPAPEKGDKDSKDDDNKDDKDKDDKKNKDSGKLSALLGGAQGSEKQSAGDLGALLGGSKKRTSPVDQATGAVPVVGQLTGGKKSGDDEDQDVTDPSNLEKGNPFVQRQGRGSDSQNEDSTGSQGQDLSNLQNLTPTQLLAVDKLAGAPQGVTERSTGAI